MYRGTEVAFGRTGFIGQQLMVNPHGVVREYYLMQAFAHAYTNRELRKLAYYIEAGGRGFFVDSGTAARYRDWARIRATYDGGEVVYSNLSDKPWTVEGHTLAASGGTLAVGPRATAWTAVVKGQIADFAQYGDTTYADARSHQWLPQPPRRVEGQRRRHPQRDRELEGRPDAAQGLHHLRPLHRRGQNRLPGRPCAG
jgi:hypothetical protein